VTDSSLVTICALALAVALSVGFCARERDADREAARALATSQACADGWERTIAVADQCLDTLDDVRAADVACACWDVMR
jgi:hypothetical protein